MKRVHFGEAAASEGKSEVERGRRNDGKTIKKDSEDERDETSRGEGPAKKDDAQREKIRGEKNAVDSNASRTRGPCSPGHSGPQARYTFFGTLSEALKSGLFGTDGPPVAIIF